VNVQPLAVRTRVRVAVETEAIAVALVAAVVVFLVVGTWQTWGDLGGDTGYDLVAATRVAHGQLPYGDFTYYYGPLAPLLLGFAMFVGGSTISTAVAFGIVLAGCIVAATYALARRLTGPLGAALAATLVAAVAFAPGNFSYVLAHTESAPLAVLATLLFLLSLERRSLLAAGICAGVVLLTRPEFALAVLLAAALVLVARRRTLSRRDVATFAAPAVGIPALVYGLFLTQVSLHGLLLDNLYPRHQLASAGNAILRVQAPLTASSFGHLAVKLVVYAAAAGAATLLARRLPRRWESGPAWFAAAGGGVAVVALAWRPETLRYLLEYAYGWIPAGAAIAAVVLAVRAVRRREGMQPLDELRLALTVVLAVLAAKVYAGFFFHASVAQPAVYAAPFAALFLVALHLSRTTVLVGLAWLGFLGVAGVGLSLRDATAASASVTGPGGTMTARPGDARMYQQAIDWITAGTPIGGTTLVAPQLTALYTLSRTTDPLPELSLVPGALPDAAAEQRAIVRLAAASPRVIVTDRHRFTEYGQTSFGKSFDRILAAWIRTYYQHASAIGGGRDSSHTLDVWLRRAR
jgi:Dolichyl-phosphate-mannose-protein mannosyltransferase